MYVLCFQPSKHKDILKSQWEIPAFCLSFKTIAGIKMEADELSVKFASILLTTSSLGNNISPNRLSGSTELTVMTKIHQESLIK